MPTVIFSLSDSATGRISTWLVRLTSPVAKVMKRATPYGCPLLVSIACASGISEYIRPVSHTDKYHIQKLSNALNVRVLSNHNGTKVEFHVYFRVKFEAIMTSQEQANRDYV